MIEVYLKEIDAGTDNACWVACNRLDPGAVPFFPASYSVHANRLIDDLTLMNQQLIAEKRERSISRSPQETTSPEAK